MSYNHLDLQLLMLADNVRIKAYKKAIFETVKKGDIIIDIGTGTGILTFFACQAGAKKVYAIEKTDIIETAKQIAKDNNMLDKIVFIKEHSMAVTLSEKADVIISETLGTFALEENILNILYDARKRFLKPGGIIIPYSIDLFAVPVEAYDTYQKIDIWKKDFYKINISAIRDMAMNNYYIRRIESKCLLCDPLPLEHFNLRQGKKNSINGTATYSIKRKGVLYGLVGWFNARLSKGITLSNSPLLSATHWENIFFPIQKPTLVQKGDFIKINILEDSKRITLTWKVKVINKNRLSQRSQKIYFKHSTFKGLPLSLETLKCLKKSSGYKVRLSKEGQIELFILGLCNGRKTIHEIAILLKKKHLSRYKTIKQAAYKVVTVIGKYKEAIPLGDKRKIY